jgi:hypothetical protein
VQIDWDSADKVFHLAIGVGTFAAAGVGLLIRNALQQIQLTQAEDKAELVRHQAEIKSDLNEKHAENTKTLAVHMAEDKQIFQGISKTLETQDKKLDKLTDTLTAVLRNGQRP